MGYLSNILFDDHKPFLLCTLFTHHLPFIRAQIQLFLKRVTKSRITLHIRTNKFWKALFNSLASGKAEGSNDKQLDLLEIEPARLCDKLTVLMEFSRGRSGGFFSDLNLFKQPHTPSINSSNILFLKTIYKMTGLCKISIENRHACVAKHRRIKTKICVS